MFDVWTRATFATVSASKHHEGRRRNPKPRNPFQEEIIYGQDRFTFLRYVKLATYRWERFVGTCVNVEGRSKECFSVVCTVYECM